MSDSMYMTARRPAGPSMNVAFTSTSGCITTEIPTSAQSVTLYCSVAAWVRLAVGTTQTVATASDWPVPANVPVTIPMPQRTVANSASEFRVWAAAKGVTVTSTGTMYVQPNAD